MRGRLTSVLAGLAVALAGGLVVVPGQQASAVISGTVMSGTTSSMWQTNGTVETVLVANGVIYAGGRFTSVRPPGTGTSSSQRVTRNRLAAFDASTGALITSFRADADATVKALAISPDGRTLYVGGNFRTLGGSSRNRVAALNATTGAVVSGFNPNAGAAVNTLAASADTVYLGGAFGKVGGVSQPWLAAVSAANGSVRTGFRPTMVRRPDSACTPGFGDCPDSGIQTFKPAPTALATDATGSFLLVGGNFIGTNGSSSGGMAKLNPATGDNEQWLANGVQPINTNCSGRVTDIAISGSTAFVTGEGDPPGCYEGTYAARLSDGQLSWNASCLGATQAIAVLKGVLYKGSHQHDCAFTEGGPMSGYVGGTSRGTFVHFHLVAQDVTDGSFVHWVPDTNGTGSQPVGPHAMDATTLANGTGVVVVGGDFTRVNDAAQQGLARFVEGGNTAAPTQPGQNVMATKWPDTPLKVGMILPLTVQATGAGTLTVEVPAADDPDTGVLQYRIYRDGASTPVATLSAESWGWSRPVIRYHDRGLAPGSTHSYRVVASDGLRNSPQSAAVSGTVRTDAAPTVVGAYGASAATTWWRLGDSGTQSADASGNGHGGTFVGGVGTGSSGVVSDDSAVTLDGSSGYVTSETPLPSMNAYSQAVWFRTTTTKGGVLVAQSDQRTGAGGTTDRMITMDNNGGLVFAMKAGSSGVFGVGTINIRNQGVIWNDGQWHLAVGTYDGDGNAALYVDGWLQGTATGTPFDPTAKANGLPNPYLRAGYADVSQIQVRFGRNFYNNKWPSSPFFAGSLDEVAVYDRALSQAQIANLYAAGIGTP